MAIITDPKYSALFEHNYGEALRIARRLHSSLMRLQTLFPLPQDLDPLSEEIIDSVDAFRTRFADLQDCLGNKVFRTLLTLEEEPTQTMLDVLHKMEKRGIITSYQEWKRLRELRNIFSHDYPETQAERSEALNLAYQSAPQLLAALHRIFLYAGKKLGLELEEPPHAD